MRLRSSPVGVKVGTLSWHVRGLGFDSRVRTLFSIDDCCIYLVFTFVHRLLSACTLTRGARSIHDLVPYSFRNLIGRAPPALHL